MTQQIKFRGFRTDGKGWVEGFYWASLDPCSAETRWRGHFIHNGCNIESPVQIHPESLGMFTGQTDKNGREIFGAIGEKGGDIISKLRRKDPNNFISELFHDPQYYSIVLFKNSAFWTDDEAYLNEYIRDIRGNVVAEIIGNQFENNGN
jgi:hypothetical protein